MFSFSSIFPIGTGTCEQLRGVDLARNPCVRVCDRSPPEHYLPISVAIQIGAILLAPSECARSLPTDRSVNAAATLRAIARARGPTSGLPKITGQCSVEGVR